jgi:succinate dehydrogenase / fumarate reductase cytochrome b subunit
MTIMQDEQLDSWWVRNEFLIRRLHSLSGLIPVGAYMVVHLLTNASVLESATTFQKNVYSIHALGRLLPFVEWTFILIPILFHAILGVVIIRGGLPNHDRYPYRNNIRYTLQRVTGMIAFAFIAWHVFHMHGWIHVETWRTFAERFLGAQFAPHNAASSAAAALQISMIVQILYAVGILACVFHLANGLWTMGITWGVWISPRAQARANYLCAAMGVVLAVLGLSTLVGFSTLDVDKAYEAEEVLRKAKIAAGEIRDIPEKQRAPHGTSPDQAEHAVTARSAPSP